MKHIALLSPSDEDYDEMKDATISRLCNLFSDSHKIMCFVVAPQDFRLSDNKVQVVRAAKFEEGRFRVINRMAPFIPDYVFFFSYSDNPSYNHSCRQLLSEFAKRGVLTNHDPDSSMWGIKSVLENRLRAYESATKIKISRPRTEIIHGSSDKIKIIKFLNENGPSVLKPHNSSRSRGMRILISESQVQALIISKEQYVLQQLIPNPATLNGKKVDLRIYVQISDLQKPSYHISRIVLVKSAFQPYMRGSQESEFCGVSYSRRQGFHPTVYLLEEVIGSSDESSLDWKEIQLGIQDTLDSLMNAVAWRARTQNTLPHLLFWGIDLAIQLASSGSKIVLLEINTWPALYQSIEKVDGAMDHVYTYELFGKAVNPSRKFYHQRTNYKRKTRK